MSLHSETLIAAADGRRQDHRGAGVWLRNHFNLATELLGAAAHAFQSLTMIGTGFVESMTVVLQFQNDRAALDLQFSCGGLASRMSRDVVYPFLENQKDFATDLGVNPGVLIGQRRVEVKLDVARRQPVARKSSPPWRPVDNVV